LERHQTLRHAVQWSYDLLDEPERVLLEQCSVFAGGFDLESACAIASSDDEFVVLDLLDALVRKSLVVADRTAGHTRFSILETIRQFAEEHLVSHGDARAARTLHANYFARKADETVDVWDGPRQREAYDWFAAELPNLRTAFRWSADQNDLDVAATMATQAGWFGVLVENFEPVTWAEELVEPTRAAGHRRFVSVCAIASLCYMFGRADDAVGYSTAGESAIRNADHELPFGPEQLWLGAVYSSIDEPERYVAFYRRQMARGGDTHHLSRACVVISSLNAGLSEEALSASIGLVEAAEKTQNPYVLSFALLVSGMARSAVDPVGALDALRWGLRVAQESGNRGNVSYLAMSLAMTLNRIDGASGDPLLALDNMSLPIDNYYDSGNITQLRAALGLFMTFLDLRGDHEPAAVLAGFAIVSPTAAPGVPEFTVAIAHLRELLGEQTFAMLSHQGADMTMAGIVGFAYDEIDRVRHELEQ
jgi:hypothetical protein